MERVVNRSAVNLSTEQVKHIPNPSVLEGVKVERRRVKVEEVRREDRRVGRKVRTVRARRRWLRTERFEVGVGLLPPSTSTMPSSQSSIIVSSVIERCLVVLARSSETLAA